MKKLNLLFAFLIPILLNGQAISLVGPNTACEEESTTWSLTANDGCVCAVEVLAIGGVNCDTGESQVTIDPPFQGGPAGCEEQFPPGLSLPFEMCWEELDGVICATPVFCDGSRGRRTCYVVTEDEDCDKDTCDDGILNGDEYTVDCGPSCECICDVNSLEIYEGSPIEVCMDGGWAGISATPGLYEYQWTISPGYPAGQIYNTGGPFAMVSINAQYSFQYFYVSVTAKDCNGNTLSATVGIIAMPCDGWGWFAPEDPHGETSNAVDGYSELPLKVHPNPITSSQTLRITGLNRNFEYTNFEVLGLSGRAVQSGRFRTDEAQIQLSEELKDGMYLIRFIGPDGSNRTKKIMVKNH